MDGRDADGTAAAPPARRGDARTGLVHCRSAAGAAVPTPPPSLGHRADTPHPGGLPDSTSRRPVDAGVGGEFPTVAGPQALAGASPRSDAVRPGWWSGRLEVAARVCSCSLVALLVGVVLGCALGMMSVVVPGLFPALG